MAVNKVPADSTLKLEVQTGIDGSGNPKFANVSFYDIKTGATNQDLYDTVVALADLSNST